MYKKWNGLKTSQHPIQAKQELEAVDGCCLLVINAFKIEHESNWKFLLLSFNEIKLNGAIIWLYCWQFLCFSARKFGVCN